MLTLFYPIEKEDAMRAFVTGATGLLGGNLVRQLVQEGHQVTALVRSRTKAQQVLVGLDIAIIEGDIADVAAFEAALAGHDVVFHTAAFFREYYQPGVHGDPLQKLNVDATIALLEAAERQGVRRVIHTSSNGVIGARANGAPADESDAPDAYALANGYFKSKVLAEKAIAEFLTRSSLDVVLILPGWMFGPGDAAPTSSGQIVLDFMARRLPGIIPGGGAPVDARDVAQAMIAAATRGRTGERYIVGGDRYVPFAELFALLSQTTGVAAPKLRIPYVATLAYAFVSELYGRITGKPVLATVSGVRTLFERRPTNSAKAVRELGATFRPLADTLRDEVAWYRANNSEKSREPLVSPAPSQ